MYLSISQLYLENKDIEAINNIFNIITVNGIQELFF